MIREVTDEDEVSPEFFTAYVKLVHMMYPRKFVGDINLPVRRPVDLGNRLTDNTSKVKRGKEK